MWQAEKIAGRIMWVHAPDPTYVPVVQTVQEKPVNTTLDGFNFEVGRPEWDHRTEKREWRTLVTIRDGDKAFAVTVITDGNVKGTAVPEAVAASMRTWSYRGANKPDRAVKA